MSRGRLVFYSFVILAALALSAGCGTTTAGGVDDLEKRMEALSRRVDALEKQLQAVKAGGGAPNQAQEQAAQVALGKINQLVAQGNVEAAKTELTKFQREYAGTRTASGASRLAQELAVVGKESPRDWRISKWFQGESDVNLTGGEPTLVVFWETWCPHCKREVPKLQAMYDNYKGQGLQIVGLTKVNRSATDEGVSTFIADNKLNYPIAKEDGTMTQYFGVSGVPAAAVVKDGKIVWRGHPARITDAMLKSWM